MGIYSSSLKKNSAGGFSSLNQQYKIVPWGHHYFFFESRIRETQNLSTDAKRSTDTEKTYKDFSSTSGDLVRRGWAAVNSTAEHRSTLLSIELHCIFCRTLEGPAYTWLFNFRPYVHPSVRPSVRMSPIRSVYSQSANIPRIHNIFTDSGPPYKMTVKGADQRCPRSP